jgi:NTE family protein
VTFESTAPIPEPKPILLALQGGGAHGALTWGVLDRLLEDSRLDIAGVSGTSAGAMNAVVLADGLRRGGREEARRSLRSFWRGVSEVGLFSPFRRSHWDRLNGKSLDRSPGYLMFEGLSRVFSPYELNPLGFDPLRELLLRHVDFEQLRTQAGPEIHVTATNVRTGLPRVFSRAEISADAVMASACLPQLSPAVEIDGEPYWDGGFTSNPALWPLVESSASDDIVIVQINPTLRPELPRKAREIINRVSEITFNTSLVKELRALHLMQRILAAEGVEPGPGCRVLLHRIPMETESRALATSSKLDVEWSTLSMLFDQGRHWAELWLGAHAEQIGVRSSLDLAGFFSEPPKLLFSEPPKLAVTAPPSGMKPRLRHRLERLWKSARRRWAH